MISTTPKSTSLLSYLSSHASPSTGGSAAANAATSEAQASMLAAAKRPQGLVSKQALDTRQSRLWTDLQATMTRAGVTLGGSVAFTLDSGGKLQMAGSDADKAAMSALMKADTSKPSLSSRMSSLVQNADQLSASVRQSAAISQAARGGATRGIAALYTSLRQQQSHAGSVYSVSASGASLAYPGILLAKA